MTQETTPQAVQISELSTKLQQDNSHFSDFETKFITEQVERIEQYGNGTRFSEKQIALIEKIHAEKVRGELPQTVEKQANPVALSQLKQLAAKRAIDVDGQFSDFESEFISSQARRAETDGDAMQFSEKQVALIERMHAEKIRGEKPKPKTK